MIPTWYYHALTPVRYYNAMTPVRHYIKALPKPVCHCGRPGTHVVVNRFNAETSPLCLTHARAVNATVAKT